MNCTEENFNKLYEENRMLKSEIQLQKQMRLNIEKNYKKTNELKDKRIEELERLIEEYRNPIEQMKLF